MIIAGGVSLGSVILVSLVIAGEPPWFTTGWRHLLAQIQLFVIYIAMIIGFFVWEERRYRAKRQ